MPDQTDQAPKQDAPAQRNVTVRSDLEYAFRDMFFLYAGPEDIVLELGNEHRSTPNQATISNRIVLNLSTAFRLQQALTQTLEELRRRVQERTAKAAADRAAEDMRS